MERRAFGVIRLVIYSLFSGGHLVFIKKSISETLWWQASQRIRSEIRWGGAGSRSWKCATPLSTYFDLFQTFSVLTLCPKTLLLQRQWWLLLPEKLFAQKEMNGSLCASQWHCVHCNPITTVNSVRQWHYLPRIKGIVIGEKYTFFRYLWVTYLSVYWSQTIRLAIYQPYYQSAQSVPDTYNVESTLQSFLGSLRC